MVISYRLARLLVRSLEHSEIMPVTAPALTGTKLSEETVVFVDEPSS